MDKRVRGAGRWLWALGLACLPLAGCGSRGDAAPDEGEGPGGAGGQGNDGLYVTPDAPDAGAGTVGAAPNVETPKPDAGAISARSFAVKAHLKFAEEPVDVFLEACQDLEFTARFVEQGGAWSFVVASDGAFASAVVHPKGGRYEIEEAAEWPDASLVIPAPSCDALLYMTQLSFKPGVADAGGRFAEFEASGAGLLETQSGDLLYSADVEVQLIGAPDTKAPSVRLPTAELHPLEANEVWASEALAGETLATLAAGGGESLELEHARSADDGAFWSFKVPPVLAFGRTLTWRAAGADLAGNALLSKGALRTLADPGLLPQEGFEGEVPASSALSPKLVSQGALSGSRSLLIDEDDKVTFHLATGGGSLLRFDALNLRLVGADADDWATVRVSLGVVGGTQVIQENLTAQFQKPHDLTGKPTPFQMEVALPEAGDELIVTFEIPAFEGPDCFGFASCESVPALIDDLRVE